MVRSRRGDDSSSSLRSTRRISSKWNRIKEKERKNTKITRRGETAAADGRNTRSSAMKATARHSESGGISVFR
ncbi:hypothetical protein KIN20_021167 [Parelaphostrongylus tenuis]|uniref:Uncharacterized protein n=1 Tax=Parelaphostrongylus tenuis TaxID=148309 RepID=A0AAD5MNT3_PARTN|nr:hypothetical protein KIN20_021167 [Parelaphostrongylus tenuis]